MPHAGAPKRIDSPKNPHLKALVRLRERRAREREGRFLIEGAREVARALQAGVALEEVLFAPDLLREEGRALLAGLEGHEATRLELSTDAFAKVSYREGPDGVLALASTWRLDPAGLTLPDEPLLLVVDGLEKPGNLGALLRSADAVDADAVFVTGSGTDLFNPNVIRASMGSVFSRPVLALDPDELRSFLAGRARIVATSPAAGRSFWDVSYLGPTAIVLGAEHAGLETSWLGAADERVSIPMGGLADSLNVATAGALLLFEALRQRRERDSAAP